MRARILRRLIAPFNWHRDGYCRFPVLCYYDDLLIGEIDGYISRKARWRDAKRDRQRIDEVTADYLSDNPTGIRLKRDKPD